VQLLFTVYMGDEMARPKKFKSVQERREADTDSSNLMRDILDVSRLSSGALAAKLSVDIAGLTGDTIRQYSCGRRRMGDERQMQLARAAAKHGYVTPRVAALSGFVSDSREFTNMKAELSELSQSVGVARKRATKAAVLNFDSALKSLIALGWNDAEIIGLASAGIESACHQVDRTGGGGIVDMGLITGMLTQQPAQTEAMWLSWKCLPLNEVQPADLL
jgi:hypothetical protein